MTDAKLKDEAKIALERRLFLDPDLFAYVVMDGAQVRDLPGMLFDRGSTHECLFSGALDPEVEAVAPQLVALTENEDDFDWAFDSYIENNALVFIVSSFDLVDVRRHMRKLALAEMPDGAVVFFRYYDPRTLLQILPMATDEQASKFYGRGGEVRFLIVDPDFNLQEFGAAA